jgi:hypothetical protein
MVKLMEEAELKIRPSIEESKILDASKAHH